MAFLTAATPTAFVRRYLDAQTPVDADALAACRHPEFEIHWPRGDERIRDHPPMSRSADRRHAIEAYFGALTHDPVGTHEAFLHPTPPR